MAADYSLGAAELEIKVDLSGLDAGLDQAEQTATSRVTSISDSIGGALKTGLLAASAAVAAAVVGIGAAAVDTASQSQQAQRDIQAQLGVTADEAQRLKDVALGIFGNNFADSIEDAAQSMIVVRQQLRGLSDSELKRATESALALRDVFGKEIPESTNAAAALMTNFGLSQKDAFDFISAGLQRGMDRSGDLLASISEYSTQFSNGGMSAAQFFSTLETGLGTGVLGTDKAADLFKEFVVRIQDGSTLTRDSLNALGIDADRVLADLARGTIAPADAFELVLGKLRETDNQALLMQSGVGLLGTQFEDLGASAVLAIDTAATSMEDMAGATDSLNAKYGSLGSVFEGVRRQILVSLEPVGQELLDLANQVMPYVMRGFTWFQSVLPGIIERVRAVIAGAFGFISGTVVPTFLNIWAQIGPAVQTAASIITAVAGQAFAWGQGIAQQLGAGVISAASSIILALQQIGAVIRYWLQPNSPPKIVPDLDRYGTEAAQLYLDSWGEADFDMLKQLGGTIDGLLRSIYDSTKGLTKEGLVPQILGTRAAVADAIEQLRTTGEVGEESFEAIRRAAGPAGDQIVGVFRAMVEVERRTRDYDDAQQALNDRTAEYKQILDELHGQLDGINDAYENSPIHQQLAANRAEQEALRNAEERARLQEILNDADATEAEKREAALKLQEQDLKAQLEQEQQRRDAQIETVEQQIAAKERERDAALAAEQSKVDAAKLALEQAEAELATRQAAIDTQREQLGLVREQTQLLEQLAQAAKAAGAAAAGGGSGGGGIKVPNAADLPVSGAGGVAGGAGGPLEQIAGAADSVSGAISTATAKVESFKAQTVAAAGAVQGAIDGVTNRVSLAFGPAFTEVGVILSTQVLPPLHSLAEMIAGAIQTALELAAAKFTQWYTAIGGAQGIIDLVSGAIVGLASALGQVVQFVNNNVAVQAILVGGLAALAAGFALSTLAAVAHSVATTAGAAASWAMNAAQAALNAIMAANPIALVVIALAALAAGLAYAYTHSETFRNAVDQGWAAIKAAIGAVWDYLNGTVWPGLQAAFLTAKALWIDPFVQAMQQAWAAIQQAADTVRQQWESVLWPALQGVYTAIRGGMDGVKTHLQDAWNFLHDQVIAPIVEKITTLIDTFLNGGKGLLKLFWNAGESLQQKTELQLDYLKGVIFSSKLGEIVDLVWNKMQEIVGKVTGIASALYSAGRGIVDQIKAGIESAWAGLVGWWQQRLEDLRNQLPFSPPKDPRSPLRDLPNAGAGIVEQIQGGIDAAAKLVVSAPLIAPSAFTSGGFGAGQLISSLLPGISGGGQTVINNFDLTAQYQYQSEQTLAQEVRLLTMLQGGVG